MAATLPQIAADHPTAPGPITVERVTDFESIRQEWTALAAECDNIFWTWEWQSLWWRHFGRGRPLLVNTVRARDGRLIAIVPLYLVRSAPLRVLRFIGHGHGDCLGPIRKPADAPFAIQALRELLKEQPFDILIGDHIRAGSPWAVAMRATVLRRTGYPLVRLGGLSWEQYLASHGGKKAKHLRRYERQLAAQYAVDFRACSDPRELDADLDAAFRLHQSRFGPHTDCWFCGDNEQFQREFAATALERGWLSLRILTLDGRPAAVLHHFRFNGIEFGYQGGRDRSFGHVSVGSVIETNALRHAAAQGLSEYRFLQGDEDYKYRFANEDPGLQTVVVAGSALGRLAIAGGLAAARLPLLKALAKRLTG
jgi:CelD/BcsL family acetyltransferase involved in cellulose biosynthesis